MVTTESPVVEVRVSGPMACFTRPEMKTERVSYDVMTPSAAVGILESIYWRPQFRYRILSITVLAPIRYISIQRNEIKQRQTIGRAQRWASDGGLGGAFISDTLNMRAQRHTRALRDVDYLIRAAMIIGPEARNVPEAYRQQFNRRIERGQSFTQPYLGCREFSARFTAPRGDERPIGETRDLGQMLLAVRHHERGKPSEPIFFDAALDGGVLRVPAPDDTAATVRSSSDDAAPGGAVLGWLREYANHIEQQPAWYAERPVRYWIDIDESGALLRPQPQDTADPSRRSARIGERSFVPTLGRSSNTQPLLFADRADYTFGIGQDALDSGDARRAGLRHRAYLDLLTDCERRTDDLAVRAVRLCLESDPIDQLDLDPTFDPGASIGWRVNGADVTTLPAVRAYWAELNDSGGDPMQCLVCGRMRPAERTMRAKIKGVPGTQSSGAALVSAHAESSSSYGLTGALNGAMCGECARDSTSALQALLASDHALRMRRVVIVPWFAGGADQNPLAGLLASDTTAPAPQPDPDDMIHVAALSGTGGRITIRDALAVSVSDAAAHAQLWLSRLALVGNDGAADAAASGLYALAGATANDLNDVLPTTVCALVRGYLTGEPLPLALIEYTLRHVREQGSVYRNQAALIKLVLCSRHPGPEEDQHMASLDETRDSIAYQCGRLLAELAGLNRQIAPRVGLSPVERRYAVASINPRAVFASLLVRSETDIATLRRRHRAAGHAVRERIDGIVDLISEFPKLLTLSEQADFALGYYHQRAANRAGAAERIAQAQNKGGDQT